jgi:mevalonate kinase
MKQTFYSNGKLLLTGEYVVLDGAISLALPTKMGQFLEVENIENNKIIKWKSFDTDGSIWFEADIRFDSIIKKEQFDETENTKNTLIEILNNAYLIDSNFITNSEGYLVETQLTFPRNWGLGTSSTLINNIAQWTGVDAFILLANSFGGSGYDIACAKNDSAILYQIIDEKPVVKSVNFNPIFKENIYFVYLNQKQNSRNAIVNYRNNINNLDEIIPKINQITNDILTANDLKSFAKLLQNHEIILSDVLEMQTIKESVFNDFNGIIKSLGAWGGDFVMVISNENPTDYFAAKGFETILKYEEMILNQP